MLFGLPPDAILKTISCKCKKDCTGACGCRKIGLKCSVLCLNCNGTACENTPHLVVNSDSEDPNEDDDFISLGRVLEETYDTQNLTDSEQNEPGTSHGTKLQKRCM